MTSAGAVSLGHEVDLGERLWGKKVDGAWVPVTECTMTPQEPPPGMLQLNLILIYTDPCLLCDLVQWLSFFGSLMAIDSGSFICMRPLMQGAWGDWAIRGFHFQGTGMGMPGALIPVPRRVQH